MNLFGAKSKTRDASGKNMQKYICPAAYGILRSYFPGLESMASIPEMQGFPKVEDLNMDVSWTWNAGLDDGKAPSSQSEIFEYIAAATRMSRIIRTAKEKLGLHGRR
jgi:hypothetical protein